MNLIGTCCSGAAAWFAVSLEDRMPRRKVLIWGTLACSILLAANAAFSAVWAGYGEVKNLNIGRAGAAFFCKHVPFLFSSYELTFLIVLFGVVYAFTVRLELYLTIISWCLISYCCSIRLFSPCIQRSAWRQRPARKVSP